jgi:glycosyltransferase involved in cell wall biosynthesis
VIHHGLEPAAVDATVKHGLACLGRLSLEKGFDLAIQALAGLDSGTRAGLKIAGDGPQRERLVGLTRELGLTSRVSWAGWVATEQVGRFIAEAELVLVPSREEAFGLTALEAAFAGRPVVASRVGGLPEVVLEGQTGLLVPPEDVRALIEAIQHLLSHPEMASAMGREAARLARRRFPLSRCVDGYEKLFRDLASRNTPQDRPGYGRKSRSC